MGLHSHTSALLDLVAWHPWIILWAYLRAFAYYLLLSVLVDTMYTGVDLQALAGWIWQRYLVMRYCTVFSDSISLGMRRLCALLTSSRAVLIYVFVFSLQLNRTINPTLFQGASEHSSQSYLSALSYMLSPIHQRDMCVSTCRLTRRCCYGILSATPHLPCSTW